MKGDRLGGWRYVVLVSGIVAAVQLVVGQARIGNDLMDEREKERTLRDDDEDVEQTVDREADLEQSEGGSNI